MSKKNYFLFEKLIYDALASDESIFTVSNGPAVCEAKTDKNYPFTINDQWATIGNEKKSWHMHIDLGNVVEAKFVEEPGCVGQSYSLRFFDSKGSGVIRIYFSDSVDKDGKLVTNKESKYREMLSKYKGRTSIKLAGE